MTRKEKKYLFDIISSIDNIFEHHLLGIKEFSNFENNITILRAMEREIGIIGEAAYHLQKSGVILTISDSLINKRNTIVHQYDVTKPLTIWNFVQNELKDVQEEVRKLIEK